MPSPLAPLRTAAIDPRSALEPIGHGSLHGTVSRSMVGAGAGALLADLVCRFGDVAVGGSRVFMVLVAAGALAGVASRGRRWLAAAIGGGLGALGSLAVGLTAHWVPFSAALFGIAAAPVLGEGESARRKLLTGVVAGAFGYAGLYVARALVQADFFAPLLPAPMAVAAAGATAGLFIGLAAAPRHLLRTPDPVEVAYAHALEIRDGELHGLLDRALTIHRATKTQIEARGRDRDAQLLEGQVARQVIRILHIAEHCRRVEADLAGGASERVEDRLAQLERKRADTEDPLARETYAQAISSLTEQKSGLERLRRGRERVVARLHVDVALLEKLQMSILQLRTADAERIGGDSGSVHEALEELAREIDATAEAIGEVYAPGATSALPAPGLPRPPD